MSDAIHISPTNPKARITSVDMVRGFALFGVLLVNMYNFGAYYPEWDGIIDRISFSVMHSVFETKSWRLFSILFGFGFALQMLKIETQGTTSLAFYFRRLFILLFIGMVHTLFYDGDILTQYAVLGIILLLFRRLEERALLLLIVLFLAVFPVGNAFVSSDQGIPEILTQSGPTLIELRENDPYQGTIGDVIKDNAPSVLRKIWRNPLGSESSIARFAMFLIGLYVGRRRILHDIPKHLSLIRKTLYWGLGVGITSAALEWLLGYHFGYAVFRDNMAPAEIRFLGDILFVYGSTALALGYAAGIILLAHGCRCLMILKLLENLGKMALTVYLSGSLMFTTLFYGYGFGQSLLIGPTKVTAYAILFFLVQLVFCALWLRWFRFGPMEWAWRSLTYWKLQPLRNTA